MWRAQIVLWTADGLSTDTIIRYTGTSKTSVWRWQQRVAEEGVDGLVRDKTRPSRVPPLTQEVIDRVLALTFEPPPREATHWTGAMMAETAEISVSSVQRIWRRHGLQPHRVRHMALRADFVSKLSNDPAFADKLRDVVGAPRFRRPDRWGRDRLVRTRSSSEC